MNYNEKIVHLFCIIWVFMIVHGKQEAKDPREKLNTHQLRGQPIVGRPMQMQQTDISKFKDKYAKQFKVDRQMLELNQVKKYFKKEFMDKGTCLDITNTAQMTTLSATLGNIWCAYCRSVGNCTCIIRYCVVDTC